MSLKSLRIMTIIIMSNLLRGHCLKRIFRLVVFPFEVNKRNKAEYFIQYYQYYNLVHKINEIKKWNIKFRGTMEPLEPLISWQCPKPQSNVINYEKWNLQGQNYLQGSRFISVVICSWCDKGRSLSWDRFCLGLSRLRFCCLCWFLVLK